MLEIVLVGGVLLGLLVQPRPGFVDEFLFVIEREAAEEDSRPEEDEVGVEDVAPAVVVDLFDLPGVVHVLAPLSRRLTSCPACRLWGIASRLSRR